MSPRALVRFFSLVCGVALGTGCGGGSSTPGASARPTPLASPVVAGSLLPPTGTAYFGAFADPSGLQHGDTADSVASLEAQLGRKLAIDDAYFVFGTRFGTNIQLDDFANGRIPLFSWNCGPPNAAIAEGTYDDSIRSQADAVKTYGLPVFVRYMWDPNLPYTQLGRTACYDPATDNADKSFSAPLFVAAWQRIHTIFAEEGAVNAVWLWTIGSAGKNALAYYPGDAYVDWTGMDAYDLTNSGSFAQTFAAPYAALAGFAKPIMISETGAIASLQPGFFSGAAQTMRTSFPLVRAFVYYDGIGTKQDWRLASPTPSTFASFAHDPYLGGSYGR
jgi:endoglucanase